MTWKPKDWNRQQAEREAAAKDKQAGTTPARDTPQPGFGTTIFVLGADGKPQPRRVRLGAADADNSIVLGGELKAGDTVVTGEVDPAAKAAEAQ
jgi:multidrug efflux pump subunit AcrA (membrane-fusion protein)